MMQPPQLRRSPRGCSPASAAAAAAAAAGSSPRWSCSSASSTPAASAAAAATAALALLLALAAAPVTTASPAPVPAPSASARRLLAAVASASSAAPVPAPGGRPHPVAKRSFFDLQCKGVYDKSIFARLDRICEDCYNLFREPQLHSLCRKNCFTSDYFKGCLDVLLLQDEMEKIQTWIKQLHGADPGV